MSTPIKLLQHIGPHHLLSRIAGHLAECRWGWFKNWAIRRLIRKYHVNVQEALSSNLDDYPNFNSFFTRRLKPQLRPIVQTPNAIASPVDGCVSQIGFIKEDAIFQAKNFFYSAQTLLGGSSELAQQFKNGLFATLYLAPKDYHRVHMPLDGKLRETIYVPGKLFSVNPIILDTVPNLFARNERLVCLFDTAAGPMAVILVGAMLVGKMETVWPGNYAGNDILRQQYADGITLQRGEELGLFKMGSTVITLFTENHATWSTRLREETAVKVGEAIGEWRT